MSIKTVTFTKNGSGVNKIKIDTKAQTIYSALGSLPLIAGRHYRLIGKNGSRIEYRSGNGYVEIQADIKSID